MSQDFTFAELQAAIDNALVQDQFTLRKKLQRLKKQDQVEQKKGLEQLQTAIQTSCDKAQLRASSVPALTYPELPVCEKKEEIAALIQQHQVVILCGETGSGKTTQLPKICLSIGRGVKGQIGHTQPRRLAAISVAERIADEMKCDLGTAVGYKIRFQGKENTQTLVKLMTDGILLSEIKSDPYLNRYDTLILDEAHERSLNIDFLIGYLKNLLPKRPDLKLIVTSATIDPERFSKHFNDAPIINVSGRTYPVEIRYRPDVAQSDEPDLPRQIVHAVDELSHEKPGDILVFLSGEREIRQAAETLKVHANHYDILPLYSRLSQKEQAVIFKPHKKPRIVLTTNVAETSVTVPGIRYVIDTGLARISRFSLRSKIQQLPIEPISQASANQRKGRCGREAPGICIRLYSEEAFVSRREFTDPEILRTNLASVLLQMKALRLSDIERFPFLQRPQEKHIKSGIRELVELGALTDQQHLTAIGKQLTAFPLDPQLARMLMAANTLNCLSEVLTIVAVLSIQDPRERPAEKAKYADEKHKAFECETSDFVSFLKLWETYQEQKQALSNNQLKKYCHRYFLSYMRMRDWEDIRSQLFNTVKQLKGFKLNDKPADDRDIHKALLSGLVTRIGQKGEDNEYEGVRQLKFHIHPSSSQFKKKPKWIMAAEQVETTRVFGRTVAAIQPQWVQQIAPHLIKQQHYEPHWSKKGGQAFVYEKRLLFGLCLEQGVRMPLKNIDLPQARTLFIRQGLVERDLDCHAPFFKANDKLMSELDYEQQKGRHVDVFLDEERIFSFYDQQLPDWVCSLPSLSKWIKNKKNERALHLALDDISPSNDQHALNPEQYPDVRLINSVPIHLSYRFDPSSPDDGVCAHVPLAQLNQMSEAPFEWLVPGLLKEKVQGLIKGLPKLIRKNYIPVPKVVDACMTQLRFAEGDLYVQLAKCLNQYHASGLKATDFERDKLEPHLSMNYQLHRSKDKVVAESKDLEQLKRQFAQQSGQQFDSVIQKAMTKTGAQNWQFEKIPQQKTMTHGGQKIESFPALVDEKTSVGLTLASSQKEADQLHEKGLIRLFRLKFNKELKKLSRQSGISTAQAFTYQQLQAHPGSNANPGEDIFDDLAHQLMRYLISDQVIRSEQEFDQAAQSIQGKVYATGFELAQSLAKSLDLCQQIKNALTEWQFEPALHNDAQKHFQRLCYSGFIAHVPYEHLLNYPRFLKALLLRFDAAKGKVSKDLEKAKQAQTVEKKFWSLSLESLDDYEKTSFRWLLEEYRISLFAQQIKTKQPISAKRLEKAFSQAFD